MGSSPSTQKVIREGGNGQFQFVTCGMRGWREEMEDFNCAETNIDGENISFFGVFDGHGGKDVAKFSSQSLVGILKNTTSFKEQNYRMALREAILKLDVELREAAGDIQCFGCGSTAITCLIVGNHIYCANVGDSRAVLCRKGQAMDISRDHKPALDEERMHIEKAGGFVKNNRVNGILSMSRALGDFTFKAADTPAEETLVTCIPDITDLQLQHDDDFIILASDGVWDAMTSQQAVNFIRHGFDLGHDAKEIVSDLFHKCLGQGENDNCISTLCLDLTHVSYDNMTAIIIRFQRVLPSMQNILRV